MKNFKGIFYAILSSTAFGIIPILAKIAYKNGSNPTTVLIFRFLIAAFVLFIYLLKTNINTIIHKKQLLILLSIGFCGYTITTQTLFMSYDYLGAGLATTLHFIYPVVVCLLGFIFLKDPVNKSKLIALLLSGLGVYALIAFKNNSLNLIGVILALFSGLSYGITVILLSTKSIKSLDNRITTMYVCIGATLGMIFYGILENSIILKFNFEILSSCVGIALISTIISIILLLKSIKIIGATSSSILGTFEPIVSIILGSLLLGENLSLSLILGTTLILSSTIILAKT